MAFNGRMMPGGGGGFDRQFPMPIPPSSINTSYSPTGINSTVQVPGAPILPNNLDKLLMEALTRRQPGPGAMAAPPPMPVRAPANERGMAIGTGAGNAMATNSGNIAMSPMGRSGQLGPFGFVERGAVGNFTTSPTVSPDRFAAMDDPRKWKMHAGPVNFGGQLGRGSAGEQADALDRWYGMPDAGRKAALLKGGFAETIVDK